jgi:alpha-L-rhamnosidase
MNERLLETPRMTTPLAAACSAGPLKPLALRCEHRADPLGIDILVPRLSWEVNDPRRGAVQAAYRVLVVSSPELLAADEGDLWDSGRVASDRSVLVEYAGRPLASRARCLWKVRTWDAAGAASPWSDPALWTMGLLAPDDWRAAWVGYDGPPPQPVLSDLALEGASFIWHPDPGDPRVAAVWGNRPFRCRFSVPAGAQVKRARLIITGQEMYEASLNGRPVGQSDGHANSWRRPARFDVTDALLPGENVLAVLGRAIGSGPAGLAAKIVVEMADGRTLTVVTDASWRTAPQESPGWREPAFDDAAWPAARVLCRAGEPPWGMPNDPPLRLVCPYLRKGFRLPASVRRATLYATALGAMELHVNGRAATDEVLAPGWTDFTKRIYYRTYDVTDLVAAGENVLAAVIGPGWYGIRSRYGDRFRLRAQLEVECAGGKVHTVATDATWRAALGPVVSSDQYDGEEYDARLEMPGWDAPGFDDAAWAPVTVADDPGILVQAHPGPPVRRTGELAAVGVREAAGGALIFDMGQNFTGWARLKVRAPAGTLVRLRFAEVLEPDGALHTANLRSAQCTDIYTCRGVGEEVWEPRFTFRGFRYVEATGLPGRPADDAVTGVVVNSDAPWTGEFECSNPLINKFWRNTTWTQRGNFVEVPTDCPQRDERLGWTGDAQIYCRAAMYNADVAAFFTKWLVDLEDACLPDGAVPDVAPRKVALGGGTAAWGDAAVVCPWTLWQMTGDTRAIERHWGMIVRWLAWCEAHSDGLLRPATGYGDWVPAGPETPKDVLATACFARSADLASRMAAAVGKAGDARRYADLFGRIREAFNRAYVSADAAIKGDTQTVYALALHFGILPDALRPAAARRLAENIRAHGDHLTVGFVGCGSLLPALTKAGEIETAYRLMEQTTYPGWLYPVVNGSTSIWERWNGWTKEQGLHDPGMNSFAHYAYGSSAAWLLGVVAGIDMLEPGFRRVLIRPRPGGTLTSARAAYRSAHGLIVSAWRREREDLAMDVTLPANTCGRIHVPARGPAAVTESDRPAGASPGLEFVGMEGGAAVYEAGAGTYAFVSRGAGA